MSRDPSAPCLVHQLVYGSPTGRGDYDFVAASTALGTDSKDFIRRACNVAGHYVVDQDPGPAFSFYAVPGTELWAFARTVVVAETRGNVYRTRVLLLEPVVLRRLSFDPFGLEGLLPREDAELPRDGRLQPIPFWEPLAVRSFDAEAAASHLWPRLLGCLRHGRVALEVKNPTTGPELCRRLFRLLPPDDRAGLSFSSHFLSRSLNNVRLSIFGPQDRENVERYGAPDVMTTERGLSTPNKEAGAFDDWPVLAVEGVSRLWGLRLLGRPEHAVETAQAFLRWKRHGDLPEQGAPLLRLAELADHPGNCGEDGVPLLATQTGPLLFHARLEALLKDRSTTVEDIRRLCRELRTRDPKGTATRWILQYAEHADASSVAVIAGLLVAIASRDSGLRPNPDVVRRGLGELLSHRPSLGLDLLKRTLSVLPLGDSSMVAGLSRLMGAFPGELGEHVDQAILDAVDSAAARSKTGRACFALWIRALPRPWNAAVRRRLSTWVSQGRLLAELTGEQLADLLPELVREHPDALVRDLEWSEDLGSLPALLVRRLDALMPNPGDRDSGKARAAHWSLVGRVLIKAGEQLEAGDARKLLDRAAVASLFRKAAHPQFSQWPPAARKRWRVLGWQLVPLVPGPPGREIEMGLLSLSTGDETARSDELPMSTNFDTLTPVEHLTREFLGRRSGS